MSDRITQEEIDCEATSHLRAILPLLERIGGGSADQAAVGYVEYDGKEERFTHMGVSMVGAAYTIAWDSATYLFEDVLANAAPSLDTEILDEVQRFLSITASALDGMDLDGAPPGIGPTWVSTCLLFMARDLQKRMDNGGRGRTHDRPSTEESEPVVVDTPPPANTEPGALADEGYHPIVQAAHDNHRSFTAADCIEVMADALRPLGIMMEPIHDDAADTKVAPETLEEWRRLMPQAAKMARKGRELIHGLHSAYYFDEMPDRVVRGTLTFMHMLGTVAPALEHGNPGDLYDLSGLLIDTYREVLSMKESSEAEEAAHV